MRADMGKVLVERPRLKRRSGDSRPSKGYRKEAERALAAGDAPSREPIKKRYKNNRKFFNENLGPLRRFLEANVGRPWNKVYSDICQHVDRGNVVQKHVLTHLFDYVVTNTGLIDGELCRVDSYARQYGEPLRTCGRRHQWYVCPKTGLLRRSRYVPHQRNSLAPPRQVVLNKTQRCVRLNGKWELITVAPMPDAQNAGGYDVVRKRRATGWQHDHALAVAFYGEPVYAVARRPLSRAELRNLPIPIDWLR
jgi:hypothetical protein